MSCANEFYSKYESELEQLIECDLSTKYNKSNEDKIRKFRNEFKKIDEGLCNEISKETSVKRLHSIIKNRIFQTNKDLAMVFQV